MRTVVLGNGSLTILMDRNAVIRDFYFPHVGEENHMGLPGLGIKLGVYADDSQSFSWINEKWNKHFAYIEDTLVSDVILENNNLKVKLQMNSFVDHNMDVFIRKIRIENMSDKERELRIFIAHDYNIYETVVADTAIYDPKGEIIHFKRDRYFLHASAPCFNQFATGKTDQGFQGTWKDAEDGILSGNVVSQGNVDSVVGFTFKNMKPGESREIFYWIAVGTNYKEVVNLHNKVKRKKPWVLLEENVDYWRSWINVENIDFAELNDHIKWLYKRSLFAIRTHVDNEGAIIASCDSDIMQFNLDHYNYCWPRDASYIAMALDKTGYHELTRKYFIYLSRILENGYFFHKYWASGEKASTWHPLPDMQEDGMGIVLFALYHHYTKTKDIEFLQKLYEPMIEPVANFISEYVDEGLPKPSWDLWEERKDVHVYTVCTIIAGLKAAIEMASLLGHEEHVEKWNATAEMFQNNLNKLWHNDLNRFMRSMFDEKTDASLSALYWFNVLPVEHEKVIRTMEAIEKELWQDIGICRYPDDIYHGHMNMWPICTLFLAQWYMEKARTKDELTKAKELIETVSTLASDSGLLAEQYDPRTKEPKSVCPLSWSHAMFVLAVKMYVKRFNELK